MRRIGFAIAMTLTILMMGSLVPNRASAITFATPANIAAHKGANLLQDIACRRVWRCGPYGCGWRPVCWDDPYSHPGTYYYGYDGPFDYGYGGFYNYYGGVPLRWSRPYRPYGQ